MKKRGKKRVFYNGNIQKLVILKGEIFPCFIEKIQEIQEKLTLFSLKQRKKDGKILEITV